MNYNFRIDIILKIFFFLDQILNLKFDIYFIIFGFYIFQIRIYFQFFYYYFYFFAFIIYFYL